MCRAFRPTLAMCVAMTLGGSHYASAQTLSDSVRLRLRDRLAAGPVELQGFYERRSFQPVWSGDAGLLPRATEVAAAVHDAAREGLRAGDYTTPALRFLLDPDSLAALDLGLTRVALAYAADVANGRLDPAAVDTLWSASMRGLDPPSWLAAALDGDSLGAALRQLAPPQPAYVALRAALARYRALAAWGGWPRLPAGRALAPGDRGPEVAPLRARLMAAGDLAPDGLGGDEFDAAVEAAVRAFQHRHGLEPNGAVGPGTVVALNVPVQDRIRQIELNLERWRWLPRELGERYIMVNSAAFALEVVEDERRVMTLRAIVGRRDWPTPIVSGRVTVLQFAPVWNVPWAIAAKEVLPQVRSAPGYLERERIRVFRDSAGSMEIDPSTIDWSQVSESTFSFLLRQDPGGTNPLGGVKFAFANRFSVYIHDTPLQAPFRERARAFSHGCIRVERAEQLAEYVLRDPALWPPDSIRAAMAQPQERRVAVAEPVPVYVAYWTAWVGEDGSVEFRDDVYGWDARLAAALARRR